MSVIRDPFFDDGIVGPEQHYEKEKSPPPPPTRRSISNDVIATETIEDPISVPRSAIIHSSSSSSAKSSGSPPPPPPPPPPTVPKPETINEQIRESRPSSHHSSDSISFESDTDDEEIDKDNDKNKNQTTFHPKVHVDTQTDLITLMDKSIQTETIHIQPVLKATIRKIATLSESNILTTPLAKNLLNQDITSALPIISFCQPFSMTSHLSDIILAMPRHLMIINNQSSVSVYPWLPQEKSTSTILECFWCPFLYKLLVTTLEDNCLYVYDFISITDSIKLRGRPLSIKHESYHTKERNSTLLLPSSSSFKSSPATWSQTRFTKSNSLGIYYCYISDRQYSCMLARIDHNTRQHIKAIDCSGGSLNNNTRICAMGLSEDRIAIVLTNLVMTIYDAETLLGLKQINLARWHGYSVSGVSTVIFLWKTWLIFDPIENKVVGIGKRQRSFSKMLLEQPINACSMDNGTLALWLGYPGALVYYRSKQ